MVIPNPSHDNLEQWEAEQRFLEKEVAAGRMEPRVLLRYYPGEVR